jgi:hypothetical protein
MIAYDGDDEIHLRIPVSTCNMIYIFIASPINYKSRFASTHFWCAGAFLLRILKAN